MLFSVCLLPIFKAQFVSWPHNIFSCLPPKKIFMLVLPGEPVKYNNASMHAQEYGEQGMFFSVRKETQGSHLGYQKQPFSRNRVLFKNPKKKNNCANCRLGVKFWEESTLKSYFRVSFWHERNPHFRGVLKNCGHAWLQFYMTPPMVLPLKMREEMQNLKQQLLCTGLPGTHTHLMIITMLLQCIT